MYQKEKRLWKFMAVHFKAWLECSVCSVKLVVYPLCVVFYFTDR